MNLALVMLLGGLWHGAAWNFVIWGGFHGVLLAAERANGKRPLWSALPRPLRVGATFLAVLFSWVFFRADDLGASVAYLAAMVGLGEAAAGAPLLGGIVYQPYYLLSIAVAAAVAWGAPQTWDWTRDLPAWKCAVSVALLWASLAILATQSYNPFIYFIF